jgi:hypothetical protein
VLWWPVGGMPSCYWPPTATLDDSVDSFVQAFSTLGYTPCSSRKFEFGFQKVAIYAASDRKVLHMAGQQFFGRGWLSKCGALEDIIHCDLESIEGDPSPLLAAMGSTYGTVDTVLRRSWVAAISHPNCLHSIWAAFRFCFYRFFKFYPR